MNKLGVAGINPYMGNFTPFVVREKNKIPFQQIVTGNRITRFKLTLRVSGKIQTVQLINRHGKSAAVKSRIGRTPTPQIRRVNEPHRGFN